MSQILLTTMSLATIKKTSNGGYAFLREPTEYVSSTHHLKTDINHVSVPLCYLVIGISDYGKSPDTP
jgi:hypothetical protein